MKSYSTFVLVLMLGSNLCSGQLTLYPLSLSANLGYFSLYTNVEMSECIVSEATSESDAIQLQNNPSCTIPLSSEWFVFVSSNNVFVSTSANISSPLLQILVVCCTNGSSAAVSIVYVDVAPTVTVDVTQTAAAGVVYPNPGFVNIAPCPCNLTENVCDINCCCDAECASVISTFTCIPGPFGGNFTNDFSEFCGSQDYPLPDWHLFLCIQFINTPDLGLFYPIDTNIVRDVSSFDSRLLSTSNSFSFSDARSSLPFTDVPAYSQGDPLLLNIGTEYEYFTLPQRSVCGQCARLSPIAFLQDSFAECDVPVESSLCAAGTILDLNYYINVGSVDGGASNVAIQENILCDDYTKYVKTTTSTATANTESLFEPKVTTTTPFLCPSNSPTSSATTCSDAVVSVTYTITWSGGNIMSVSATIILADLPISSNINNILSQSFSVVFQHSTQSTTTSASGNPGYNFGYPVISGSLQSGAFVRTDELRIWNPSDSGLCTETSLVAPNFGADVISGCQLRLPFSWFDDCVALRTLVENEQTQLISTAGFISRFGNPTLTAGSSDWLPINASALPIYEEVGAIPGQCSGIPSQVEINIAYSISGRILGFPIREIVGVTVNWTRVVWQMKCSNPETCDSASADTENFFVTSSVNFILVPPGGNIAPTLAESLDNSTCARDATCWPELLLPLTETFYYLFPSLMAQTERQYNLVWGLFVIFCATGYFSLLLDWQKISLYLKQQLPL